MSVYFIKGRGWRGDFILNGRRYSTTYHKTKAEAKRAVSKRKEETLAPQSLTPEKIQTDMAFLELVNKRLDYVKAYNSVRHYIEYVSLAKRWSKLWGELPCVVISKADIEQFVLKRSRVSGTTANKELRYLRATFNFGIKREFIKNNPTEGMSFIPVDMKLKYVPSPEDIDKIIAIADQDTQDYLWIMPLCANVNETFPPFEFRV